MKRLLALGAFLVFSLSLTVAGEIGYLEDFALAKDRADALKQLIPGTEDYYYFHCLHYLNTQQFPQAEAMTKPWLERHGRTARLIEIQTRHALLTYEQNPQRALDYLRGQMNLQFNHQKETAGVDPRLPTSLDPKLFSRATLQEKSLRQWANLDNFEDSALGWLAGANLDWERRRNLLQRLQWPDVPNLPRLIAEDLRSPHAAAFGSFPIHAKLTLAQLDELVKLQGDLLNQANYVNFYLVRLQPGPDADRADPKVAEAYFNRLWEFARRLAPVHNSLKAHILYHRLAFDRAQGVHDQARFLEYLKLPRHLGYVSRPFLEQQSSREYPADVNAQFQPLTGLPPIGNDEDLVRAYLQHFFVAAANPRAFAAYIDADYLKQLFAQTKIENGLGNSEQWASDLPPELFRALRERIDIDFAPTNPLRLAGDAPVRLEVYLKNVPTLIVKVFEINTAAWYRTQGREVNTDVNLDGLVANEEQTLTYTESPLRRVKRTFEFPKLNKPGVYVIDFIGAGKSSRVVIRKGKLTPLVAVGSTGLRVTVLDEARKKVSDAKLWLGGQEYSTDAEGVITLPFSTQPGRKPIVLSRGDFAVLDFLEHPAESYQLDAGIHVEREALLTQRVATLLVRPQLRLHGQPISVKLLEDPRLKITSVDQDGTPTSTEVPNFKLFEDRESVHEIRVPNRLAHLTVELVGKVKNLSLNKDEDLIARRAFEVNGIDKSDKIEDLHLARFGPNYVLEVRGRSGEPRPNRPVQLSLKHRDFRQPVQATLKTDAQGRVMLGTLDDVERVEVAGPEGMQRRWSPLADGHTYRRLLHAAVGETVQVPFLGSAKQPSREELALLAVQGETLIADHFDKLGINPRTGLIEIAGLPAGDYWLHLKRENQLVQIRVVDGPAENGYLLGLVRYLEQARLKPLQISEVNWTPEGLKVQLTHSSPFTRVHVFAVRFRPQFSAIANLGGGRVDRELTGLFPARAESAYVTGRNIGDEYRYVLDRRLAPKFPGSMLTRPELLLNPWAVRSTETGEQEAKGGTEWAPAAPPAPSAPAEGFGAGSGRGTAASKARDLTPNLDFLGEAAAVLVNLLPEKDGSLLIPEKNLGPHALVRVVAVDPTQVTSRYASRAEQPATFRDLRLRTGLDPKQHFTQQKAVSILEQGKPFVIADLGSSRLETYDSLAKVFTLYATLSKDPKLAEFAFILNWPKLKEAEKRTLYSKFACHELSFFLLKKDPEFFKSVIRPYLANKKDQTFLDRWLLEQDLKDELDPWRHARLNTAERLLLAQRLPGELPITRRQLRDQFRLLPPDLDLSLRLFNAAVKGGELDASTKLGENLERLQEKKAKEFHVTQPGRADVLHVKPAAPGGTGGGGGPAAGAPPKSMRAREGRSAGKDLGKAEESADTPTRLSELEAGRGDRAFFDEQRKLGRLVPQLYRRVEPTMEWAENNYYKLPIQQQLAELITVSPFWVDYAEHEGPGPFLSKNLAHASRNFSEMMFALALLDLPFTAGQHDLKFEGTKLTITPAGPVIAFHEEVRPAAPAEKKLPILVSQNFYRPSERYREENGEKADLFVTDEFVVHTAYGCQVVVTNPTSSRQKLSVLVQLPVGALPLQGGQFTRSTLVDLEPYRTQTLDYAFYFPLPGRFAHFPVHVAKNEQFVAAAEPFTFNVVAQPSKLDTQSWDHVSQQGTADEVLAFLERENLGRLNLDRIAFRMRDKAFFLKTVALLRSRHVYQPTLWSYAMLHGTQPEVREFLSHADQIIAECGGPIDSAALVIDLVARHLYEHLEYKPLVNARAHALGQRRQIVNDRLLAQYQRFLKNLTYQRQLSASDQLALTYYLLLQDRVEEALASFAKVNRGEVATPMQYDYCAAYLAFFSDEPQRARPIVQKYANYPVDRWRLAFAEIGSQLDEIEGKAATAVDPQNQQQQQTVAAAGEPSFDFTVEGKKLNLAWQNVSAIRVNYYLMDVELLFSRNPFVQQQSDQFAAIRPNRTQEHALPAGQNRQTLELPADLASKNVLIEVVAGGKSRMQPYYANALDVRLMENFGQVQVSDAATSKKMAKVYVKVYVRLANGEVKFHKDGYTDHRGRFDYASVSTPERAEFQRFAILVLSEDKGALIREAVPPPR